MRAKTYVVTAIITDLPLTVYISTRLLIKSSEIFPIKGILSNANNPYAPICVCVKFVEYNCQ